MIRVSTAGIAVLQEQFQGSHPLPGQPIDELALAEIKGAILAKLRLAIGKDAGIDDALQTMLAHGVRRLAVTDADAVVGVLSLDDIVDALGAQWNMLASVLHNERERERTGGVQTPLHA